MEKETLCSLEKLTWKFATQCGMINTRNNRIHWNIIFKQAIEADRKLRQSNDSSSVCDNPHCENGVVDVVYGEKFYCSNPVHL